MNSPGGFRWAALVPDSIVRNLATCGRLGYLGKAPGTNGSVVGILLYTVFFHGMPLVGQLTLILALTLFAVVVCDEAERRLGKRDPGEIILDEVVAVPVVFMGLNSVMMATGYVWLYMLVGFGLFRLFDIAKPFGISRLQHLPGGRGVVADDIAAGVAAAVVLRLGLWGLFQAGVVTWPST